MPKQFCPVSVHPSARARAYLKKMLPENETPPDVVEYFQRLGIQQHDIEDNCD